MHYNKLKHLRKKQNNNTIDIFSFLAYWCLPINLANTSVVTLQVLTSNLYYLCWENIVHLIFHSPEIKCKDNFFFFKSSNTVLYKYAITLTILNYMYT